VTLAEDIRLEAHTQIPAKGSTVDTPDGDYLLSSEDPGSSLVRVKNNTVIMPIRNNETSATTLHTGLVTGSLEQIQECYTSDDVISSNLIGELLQAYSFHIQASPRVPDHLNESQQTELRTLMHKFGDVFATAGPAGRTELVKHRIEVTDSRPIRMPQRPIPYTLREKVAEMVQEYLERGVIRPSNSPYSNPIVLVRKKDGCIPRSER